MSKIALSGNASGTGTFTIASPDSNSDRTLNLPDAGGTVFVSGQALSATTGSFSGDLSFNSGYGSAAVAYGCRAWVNFDGTGTVAIRASGNVSSITDNGTGDYTVNFTNAMPDADYSLVATSEQDFNSNSEEVASVCKRSSNNLLTSSARIMSKRTIVGGSTSDVDRGHIFVAVFR
jgi:hypothetical protein